MVSLDKIQNVHFIGIGGISMSGLAQILIESGYTVTGSDIHESKLIDKLRKSGGEIFIPHKAENVENAELVVYTAAVKEDNPEIIRAKELNIPIIDRATFLGQIMKNYSYGIAIAGCHGKTTTTSMVSIIFANAGLDPTILIGGELDAIDGNVRVGKSQYFITEACEYVESFLKFHPFSAAILNIEEDHLDYFKDINHIISAFKKFATLIPENGSLVICRDNNYAVEAANAAKCRIITYGIEKTSDYTAKNIEFDRFGHPSFNAFYRGEDLGRFELKIPGLHNVLNALAAIAISQNAGINSEIIRQSLTQFKGTHRRFDIQGTYNDITVIDDYAHHPTEIKATLSSASKFPHNNIWCIFQPHTYTRTKTLFNEFAKAFSGADYAIITDIYAAREKDTGEIHAKDLTHAVNNISNNARYISSFEEIADTVANAAQPGDIVLTVGAGSITELGPMILAKLRDKGTGSLSR